ncbi:MAG: polysaccharide deacetylase family protein [candidate division Zixibacteria bacterium]|nr:polysaccharide deacetylase family protein [candidate division Zixibacteria bacterium]
MRARLSLAMICSCLLLATLSVIINGQERSSTPNFRREVAVTFDDLPATHGDLLKMRYITSKLLESLKRNNVPTIGFVNEGKLLVRDEADERTALLRQWLDAGYELGNHTYSHVSVDQLPFVAYKEDLIRGEAVTKVLLREQGLSLKYFRHPQLRTGPTPEYKKALDNLLAERGYTIAPVTIDNNDYIFAAVYARAKERNDRELMNKIVRAYIPYMEQVFAHFEKLSVEFLGYEVKQTLLLHANELNADHLDELAQMMKKRGYRFISLSEALKDKAYSLPDAQVKKGLSWLHRWMIAKGLEMRPEPLEPEFITALFHSYRR